MFNHTEHYVLIKRDGFNPVTGHARYRVISCEKSLYPNLKKVHIFNQHKGQVTIVTSHPVKAGIFICPRKALGLKA